MRANFLLRISRMREPNMYRPFSHCRAPTRRHLPGEERRAGARSALALVRRARDVCRRVAKFPRLPRATKRSARQRGLSVAHGRVAEKSHRSIFSKGSVIAERPAAGELDAADYICCKKENSKDMQLCRSLKGQLCTFDRQHCLVDGRLDISPDIRTPIRRRCFKSNAILICGFTPAAFASKATFSRKEAIFSLSFSYSSRGCGATPNVTMRRRPPFYLDDDSDFLDFFSTKKI